jgi:Mlc titration factor MtfA (ptsG expression regulator)
MIPSIIAGLLLIAFAVWLWQRFSKHLHRKKLLLSPLPVDAIETLQQQVALYQQLPSALQQVLQGCVNRFLYDKVFVGCNGFEVTDAVRLTVAGNACLLVLQREKKYFPGFATILIYPDTYVAKDVSYDGLVETHHDSIRAGESWQRGPVVLSWSDVEKGLQHERDGHNVILHEFAHKLDEENAIMDGLPVLRNAEDYQAWAEVLTEEYAAFLQRVEHRSNDVIDEYGAVSAAEFFAVATESFFEKSKKMKRKLPQLYAQFQNFYGLDPAQW